MTKWFLGMFLFSTLLFAGCGSEGGKPDDANAPSTTTDQEQMQDETDPNIKTGK